jgi:hypothetical protein
MAQMALNPRTPLSRIMALASRFNLSKGSKIEWRSDVVLITVAMSAEAIEHLIVQADVLWIRFDTSSPPDGSRASLSSG